MNKNYFLFLLIIIINSTLSKAQNSTTNSLDILDVKLNRYSLINSNNTISLKLKNISENTIHFMEINWSDGNTNNNAIVRTNIEPGEHTVLEHPIPVNYNDIVEKNISIAINQINSQDNSTINYSKKLKFNTVSQRTKKAVVVEKTTATWCGWCPRGIVNIENMYKKYPETFIGIAIHGRDPMAFNSYRESTGMNTYPVFDLDRVKRNQGITGEWGMEPPYLERMESSYAPANLSATGSINNDIITINTVASFFTNSSDSDYKLSIVVIENNVEGWHIGYRQSNDYSGGGAGKMGGYEDKPKKVKMAHDHVARALLGGYEGQKGSIPKEINLGDAPEYTFTYKVPYGYKKENLEFVILLLDGEEIVNGKKIRIDEFLNTSKTETLPKTQIYPNPSSDYLNIIFNTEIHKNYTVTLHTMLGNLISSTDYKNLSKETQKTSIPVSHLKSGNYLITISNNKGSYSQMIQVKR